MVDEVRLRQNSVKADSNIGHEAVGSMLRHVP